MQEDIDLFYSWPIMPEQVPEGADPKFAVPSHMRKPPLDYLGESDSTEDSSDVEDFQVIHHSKGGQQGTSSAAPVDIAKEAVYTPPGRQRRATRKKRVYSDKAATSHTESDNLRYVKV